VVRRELESLLPPIICHLFFEMLKGKEWRPAHDFLRKYSSIVGTPQEIAAQKFNGASFSTSAGPQQIHFIESNAASNVYQHQKHPSSSNHQQPQFTKLNIDETKLAWFQDLISNLSCVRRIEDGKDNKLIVTFRSCKYNAKLAKETLSILNKYLSKHGHVLIIQILHVWFSMEIYDLHSEESIDDGSTSSDGTAGNRDDREQSEVSRHSHKIDRCTDPAYCDKPNDIINQNSAKNSFLRNEFDNSIGEHDNDEATFGNNMKLKRLGERLTRIENKYFKPIRIFNINYSEKR
jgi:WD40 associated region in TFIID subunit, NTD2 domain